MPLAPWQNGITRAFSDAGVVAEVVAWDSRQPRSAIGARYALVWLPTAELFEVERDLEVVFNLGAGVDRLLANAVVPARLPIVRLVDAGMAVRMAEYACFSIARATRGLERFGPGGLRDWNASRPRGKPPTVGVLGVGAIGSKIAEAAAMFGYPVRVWSRTTRKFAAMETFAGLEELDAFLADTNFLVNALPLTRDTENLLDRARLVQLPAGAHVINVGRGATIVDADLLALLDNGHLGGATLDVFRTEPLPDNDPYWAHPKVIVTPHLSGPTPVAPAAAQIADAIVQLERGVSVSALPGYVDRARGY
ncbi:MAG: glyoxylate/hydroxypyruvate reductase A, partial [Candidatus Obscuribacterales bacterium]|nr:glyoxylate/hydroxypyruvate reductase A [Steroidobacteraceae bacterium]